MERGLSILWIDAICGSVQNSMTPPEKECGPSGGQAYALAAFGRYSRIMAEAERLRQSLLADAGQGDLLKTIIDRAELRPNGLRMILSLVPLTPAAALPNRLQGCLFTREGFVTATRVGLKGRQGLIGSRAAATASIDCAAASALKIRSVDREMRCR
jgi:hypothetical protein